MLKYGPIVDSHRIEQGFAMLAQLYANAHSKNRRFTIEDFLPRRQLPDDGKPGTIDEVFKLLSGVADGKPIARDSHT